MKMNEKQKNEVAQAFLKLLAVVTTKEDAYDILKIAFATSLAKAK